MGIISKDMDLLKNIIDVKFENCELWNLGKFEKVEQLIIINSEIESIEEIKQLKNLKDLQLINLSFENYEVLQNINKLEKLTIKNIKGFSMSKIDFYLPIKYLSLEIIPELNTNIISQYKYLETLSVDRKESKQWEKELNDLKKNGMRILLNDIYYF